MRTNRTRLATVLLATTAMGAGFVEIEANLAARARLHAFLGRHANVSVAGILAEPFTGRVMLRGVAVGGKTARVTIGRLNLPLPDGGIGLVSPALAAPLDDRADKDNAPAEAEKPTLVPTPIPAPTSMAQASSADNVTITSGQTTVRIKHIDMTGTSLTGTDIAALIDPKSSEPAEARFKKLTASAIVAPEIMVDDTTAGSERHATISQVLLSGAVAGKIAAGSVGGITFTAKTGDQTSDGTIGAIQASNLDLVQIARVFTTVRSDDAEPIRPLYDSVTVNGITISDEAKKSTLSLGTLKETGAKGRPLATDFITRTRSEKPTDAESAAAFDDMTHSFEIGAIEANDLSVKTEDKDGPSTLSLAGIAMHDFAKQKIGGLTLRALRFDGPMARFGIGTADIGAFPLPKTKSLPTSAPGTSALMPTSAKVDLGLIDFDIITTDKEKGDAPSRIKFKLAHVGLIGDGDPGDLPRASKLTVDNLTFDVPPETSQAKPLVEMGYKRVDLSAALSTNYNPAAQELTVDNLSLNGVDIGSLGIGLDLINVNKGIISPNKEIAKASALAMLIKGLKLDLINAGLFERAIAWKAKQDGMTVEQERAFAVDFFANKLPAMLNNNANVKLVGTAIAKFFTTPKGLHISIISQNGLGAASMGMLADPSLLLDTLDVKATAD